LAFFGKTEIKNKLLLFVTDYIVWSLDFFIEK